MWNGVFPYKESPCLATIFAKSTRTMWNGGFIGNSIHRNIVWGNPALCRMGGGGKYELKVHTIKVT